MALLSNVARIAGQRSMHVYGFTHLCKKHQVRYGQPEDFFALASVLREHPEFRSGVFRLAAAAMSNDPPLSLNEVAVVLAVAVGGLQIAAHQQLEVPDEFMGMLRSVLTPDELEAVAEPGASGPASGPPVPVPDPAPPEELRSVAEQVMPAPVATLAAGRRPITNLAGTEPGASRPQPGPATAPIQIPTRHAPALPHAQSRSAAPQAPSAPPRRLPILGQALRAELPEQVLAEPATPAPGPQLVAKVRLLASERQALQQRMQEIEERLTDAIQELGVLSESASTEAPAESQAQVEAELGIESSTASDAVPGPVAVPQTPPGAPEQAPVTLETHRPERQTRAPRQRREAVESVSQQPRLVHRLPPDEANTAAAVPRPSRRPSLPRWWPIALTGFIVLLLAALLGFQHLAKPHVTAPGLGHTAGSQTASSQAGSETAPSSRLPGGAANRSPRMSVPAARAQGDPQQEISSTLGRWASAAARNDPIAESALYAPSVDRYFLRRNVSRGYVLATKQAFRARGNSMGTFTISDVTTQLLSPSSAIVNLHKNWTIRTSDGTGPLHTTQSRLWLRRSAQGWQITGEQDLTSAR